jgi:hypothetical protein
LKGNSAVALKPGKPKTDIRVGKNLIIQYKQMKAIIFTIVAFACTLGLHASGEQRLKIGHRDGNKFAVLDISIAHIQPAVIKSMTQANFTNIRVTKLDISDNPSNPNYYASIGVTVEFQELGNSDVHKVTLLYPIVYNPLQNAYFGGEVDPNYIKDGGSGGTGNPDNNFCVARNCTGCLTLRDMNGKTLGCTSCVPANPDKSFSCTVESTSGMGAERVINALAGLLKGLISIF